MWYYIHFYLIFLIAVNRVVKGVNKGLPTIDKISVTY